MKWGITAVILAIVIVGGIFLLNQPYSKPATVDTKQYEGHGISFSYPAHYFLEEKNTGNAERARYSIILTEDSEENKAVREGRAPGRDGPTAIVIEIFQNDLDYRTAEQWIKETSDSNYKLSPDSVLTAREVGALSGFAYRWSGLYEARTIAVANDSFVYSFTATYLTPEDLILKDFETLLQSVKFN